MDLSKYPPHVVAAFHKFAECRAKDAYEQGRAAGREEVMAGLNALRAFLPPGGFPATSPTQLPPLTAVAAPVMLSQPTGTVSVSDTGGDEFDLDTLIDELVGENDPQVRQLILAMAMSALTEAYQAQGKDPTQVLKKLREMAKNGAVQAATSGEEVWLAWTAAQTKGGKVKAVGTDEHQGRTLYGKQAESALRSQEKRGKQTEARARRDDLVAKIDSGELFAEQDWEDFSGHLESLTGAELKDLRGKIKTALQDKMNRGVLKAGQKKSDRVANLQSGVKNLIQHAIEQAELPDPSREKGKISNLIASMGGIRPDDPEFERATGFTVRQAVENKIIPRSAVRKDGKRFSDIVAAMKEEGHIYVQDADDGSEGDYDNAVGQAIVDGRTTSNTDVYNPEEVFQKELARKSVRDRLVLARLRRDDPEEYARQRAAILGEAEAESDPVAGEDYPADWDEVGQPAAAQDERPDEYADYLADAETPAEEESPVEEAVDEPVPEQAPEPVAEAQVEPEPVAEKPVDQMTDAERQAELAKLMAEQEAEMDDERPRKKKKKRPAQAQATGTPPAPAKSANQPPADPVPARTEQAPVQTDEEFEAEFQREMAAERERRRADLKTRREQLLADPKFAPPKEVAPKSEKVIERPKDRPLTEAEQERLARERIDANQPQDGEEGPTAEDLKAAEGEAEAAVADASGEYTNPTAPTPVVGQAGKTASQQVDEEKQRRIEAMQARIAAGKGVLSDEAPPPPEDDEEKDLYAADYTERAQPEVAKKGKVGRRSLANNQSALFETRLNRDSKEAAAKAVKSFKQRGEVPPVPKVVRDAFKNAPDKDKLDSMWKDHIEQLAGEGGAAKKSEAPQINPTGQAPTADLPTVTDADKGWIGSDSMTYDTREQAVAAAAKLAKKQPKSEFAVKENFEGKWYAMSKADKTQRNVYPFGVPKPNPKLPVDLDRTAREHPHAGKLGKGDTGSPNPELPDESRPPVADRATAEFLNNYSWGYDSDLNDSLRKTGQPPAKIGGKDGKPAVDGRAMHTALQSLFRQSKPLKTPVQVRRGITVSPAELSRMEAQAKSAMATGRAEVVPGYTSTTTMTAGFEGNVQYEIEANQGVDLRPYSYHGIGENEFLMDHNSRFTILGVERVGDTLHLKLRQEPSGR